MESNHGIEIAPYKEIWNAIKEFHDWATKKQQEKKKNKIMKVKRDVFLKEWEQFLHDVKEDIQKKFDQVYKGNLQTPKSTKEKLTK